MKKRFLYWFSGLLLSLMVLTTVAQASVKTQVVNEAPVEILIGFNGDAMNELLDTQSFKNFFINNKSLFRNNENRLLSRILTNRTFSNVQPLFSSRFSGVQGLHQRNPDLGLNQLEAKYVNAKRRKMGIGPDQIREDEVVPLSNVFKLTIRPKYARNVDTIIGYLSMIPGVDYVEINGMGKGGTVPNDPLYPLQWALKNTGQLENGVPGVPGNDVNIEKAWDITKGSSNVTIAVLDSGVDPTVEFGSRLLPGVNYVTGAAPTGNSDIYNTVQGHGTPLSGIAAASGDNAEGIAGICWNCTILPVRVFDANLNGSFAAVASGINYAAEWTGSTGPRVINLSFQTDGITSKTLENAVKNATFFNTTIVSIRGNYSDTYSTANALSYPAAYPEVISVGAMNPCGGRKEKSATVCEKISSWGSRYEASDSGGVQPSGALDFLAPGVQLYSVKRGGGYVDYINGTSAAAPHVTGIVGLLLSVDPTLTPAEIMTLLRTTAVDIGKTGWDAETGYGRIDAFGALTLLCSQKPLLDACPKKPVPKADVQAGAVSWNSNSLKPLYSLSVMNVGPDAAENVNFKFTPGFTFTSNKILFNGVDISSSCTVTAIDVNCPLGTLASGANLPLTVEIASSEKKDATSQFEFTSAIVDPDVGNNLASLNLSVEKTPIVKISAVTHEYIGVGEFNGPGSFVSWLAVDGIGSVFDYYNIKFMKGAYDSFDGIDTANSYVDWNYYNLVGLQTGEIWTFQVVPVKKLNGQYSEVGPRSNLVQCTIANVPEVEAVTCKSI